MREHAARLQEVAGPAFHAPSLFADPLGSLPAEALVEEYSRARLFVAQCPEEFLPEVLQTLQVPIPTPDACDPSPCPFPHISTLCKA